MTGRNAPRLVWVAAVGVAAALLLVPLPTGWLGVWRGQILDFLHVPMFAALVVALRFGMGPPLWWPVLVSLALAGAAEVVQPWVGRSGSWADFIGGAAGALSAAAAIRALESVRPRTRAAVLALAVGLPAWPVAVAVPYLADTVEGRRAFPVLADFTTDHQLRRWECDQAAIGRADEGGRMAARLELLPGPGAYSSAALRPVVADFTGYRWLCCEFRVVGEPAELVTSVRTARGVREHTSHAQVGRAYEVGDHVARFDLADMAARGDPEPLDLAAVRVVQFFAVRLREPRTVVVYRVWLDP